MAYAHPAWMTVALGLAFAALRTGLAMRRRRAQRSQGADGLVRMRARHLILAKIAVAMIAVGFVAGPASAYFVRGWTPLSTLHGLVGCAALALFVATALRGRGLELGRLRRTARDGHARLALGAMLAAALAAATGFVLLP